MDDQRPVRRFRRGWVVRWGAAAMLAGAVILWGVSYWGVPAVSTGNWAAGPGAAFGVMRGAVVFSPWSLRAETTWPEVSLDPVRGTMLDEIGPTWWFGHETSWVIGSLWWAPMWAVVGPLAGLVWWAWRRGPAAGTCRACGYDVRGIAGACPECGGMLAESGGSRRA